MSAVHDLRCFCSRRPLLATYGINEKGELYIEIKVYKQRRIYGHVVVILGTVRLQCRECGRWQVVFVDPRTSVPKLKEDKSPLPDDGDVENSQCLHAGIPSE